MESKLFRTIGVLAALSTAAFAAAQGKITSVTSHEAGTGVEITIKGDNLSRPSISRAYRNYSLILDFKASLAGKHSRASVNTGGVEFYNYAQHSVRPLDARVQIRMTEPTEPTITEISGGWVVGFHTGTTSNKDLFVMPPMEPAAKFAKNPGTITAKPIEALKTIAPAVATDSAKPITPAEPKVDFAAVSSSDQPIALDGTPVANAEKENKKRARKSSGTVTHKMSLAPMPMSGSSFERRVSLDFANTDVVQVLKALALQANVNIVTSPDVTGKVTVSLDNVSVKDALDLVTTMAGVRYAKVGNTFIVTSPGRFSDAIKQINGKSDEQSETRVVPIYSGMGGQIQAAVERAIPTDGASKYLIILPSQDVSETSSNSSSASGGGASAAAPAAGATTGTAAPAASSQTASAKATQKSGKDTYVVLVGPKTKLDEVEPAVKELDAQLCKALLINIPDDMVVSNAVYKTNVNSAKSLLAAIVEPDKVAELKLQPNRTTVGRVQLYASNAGPQGDQLVIMRGPKNEVDQLVSVLGQLDDPGLTNSTVVLYEVKFGDPRALLDELLAQIPGLRVMIPSSSAANPGVFQENKAEETAAKQGAGAQAAAAASGMATPSANTGGSSSTTSTAGASGSGSSGSTGSSSLGQGLSLPFSALESGSVPMRLVLKGTKAQIDQALDYLKIVDVAPKQVALEMRVMELSKSDAINAGLSWDLLTGGAVKFIKLDNSQDSANNTAGGHIGGHGWGLDVAGQLDKIATSSNLISRPNMLAMDGRESELFIGDVIRYIQSISNTQNGTSVTTGEVRVGVRLSVLPRVGADGAITMELRPIVSFVTGFDRTGGVNLPQTSERIAQSTLTVKSGETLAIGGLIQDQDKRNAQGLPILMDLPIVGNLFKKTTNSKTRTELVIFLTAREVDGPATSATKLPQQMPEPKAGK